MKKNTYNVIVSPDFDKYRIDKFLQFKLKEFSRTRLQTLIKEKQVKLNNILIIDSSKKIKKGDEITVTRFSVNSKGDVTNVNKLPKKLVQEWQKG